MVGEVGQTVPSQIEGASTIELPKLVQCKMERRTRAADLWREGSDPAVGQLKGFNPREIAHRRVKIAKVCEEGGECRSKLSRWRERMDWIIPCPSKTRVLILVR